eukprot:TRINITY_DN41222_c0_g1_i1.p1 TRINITY_DN41222_c0_g1~~TRINITY_DN41222_c0_g1_i1.p1  ORF type:complete len:505 (-),score=139.89 TRINITY_DN41222_c0_g1_i1:627-2141(-)
MVVQYPDDWHRSANKHVKHSKGMNKQATKFLEASDALHDSLAMDNLGMYSELQTSFEHKVKSSYIIIEELQKRSESCALSILNTKESLLQLQADYDIRLSGVALCAWRLEQRGRRPLRERVRDAVEAALLQEQDVLEDSQAQMSEAIRKTQSTIRRLEGCQDDLLCDIEDKEQALKVDEQCLKTTHASLQTVVQNDPSVRAVIRSGSGPRRKMMQSEGRADMFVEASRNEAQRQKEAVDQNKRVITLEDRAADLRSSNVELIARCDRDCAEALQRTEAELQLRVSEYQQVRKRLAEELEDNERRIEYIKTTMSETKERLHQLEEPIELCSTCHSAREGRAGKEKIKDPVTAQLASQQQVLMKSHSDLRRHYSNEKAWLQDLKDKRGDMKCNLKDKTEALHLDLGCLSHEATTDGGRPVLGVSRARLHRAQKVDPGFEPMAVAAAASTPKSSKGGSSGRSEKKTSKSQEPSSRQGGGGYGRPKTPTSSRGERDKDGTRRPRSARR